MPPEDEILRVVIDTNVLFSALAFPADSPPSKVFRLMVEGTVQAFSSPFIVDELEKNLRTKAGWDEGRGIVGCYQQCETGDRKNFVSLTVAPGGKVPVRYS